MNEVCSHVQLIPVVGGSPSHATLLSEQMLPVQHSMLHVFCSLVLRHALSFIIQVSLNSATKTQCSKCLYTTADMCTQDVYMIISKHTINDMLQVQL